MDIFLSGGHPMNKGAKGILEETVVDREVVKHLDAILKALGHNVTVFNSEASNDYVEEVNKANTGSYDWYLDIHCNAYNGQAYGVETLVYSDNKPQAHTISKNIASLGFYNRGVKARTDLYILKNTKAKAMLVECFFIDSQRDCDLYNKVGAKAIAKAIAEGLTGQVYQEPQDNYIKDGYFYANEKTMVYAETGLNMEIGYLVAGQKAKIVQTVSGRVAITYELTNGDWLIGYVRS